MEGGEDREGSGRSVVVIGDDDLSRETASALEVLGAEVTHLEEPEQDEVREALEGDADTVAVVGRTDAVVLRGALMVRDVSNDVPLLLTIFDPTMARIMESELGHTKVASLADIVAPSLAGPCIEERFTAVGLENDEPVGLVEDGDNVREEPIPDPKARRLESLARALFTPYDKSAGLLLFGAIGLVTVFLIETITPCSCSTTRSSTRSTARPRRWSPSIPTSRSPRGRPGTSSSPRCRC